MITRTVPVIYYGVFSTVPVRFLGCPFTLTIIQAYAPTINAEEEISVQVEIYWTSKQDCCLWLVIGMKNIVENKAKGCGLGMVQKIDFNFNLSISVNLMIS